VNGKNIASQAISTRTYLPLLNKYTRTKAGKDGLIF